RTTWSQPPATATSRPTSASAGCPSTTVRAGVDGRPAAAGRRAPTGRARPPRRRVRGRLRVAARQGRAGGPRLSGGGERVYGVADGGADAAAGRGVRGDPRPRAGDRPVG